MAEKTEKKIQDTFELVKKLNRWCIDLDKVVDQRLSNEDELGQRKSNLLYQSLKDALDNLTRKKEVCEEYIGKELSIKALKEEIEDYSKLI